jgi:hypothetical protein
MILANSATRAAAILFAAAIASPVAAQQEPAAPVVPMPLAVPPAWTVSPDQARGAVEITATAKGGTAKFTGGCSKSAGPVFVGALSGYQGGGLQTDGQEERVSFYVRGAGWQELYSVRLQYSAASQSWEIAKPLAPVFLGSFSRGATLAIVNSRNEEVFEFDLTGSTAAVRTMRTVCGIPANPS